MEESQEEKSYKRGEEEKENIGVFPTTSGQGARGKHYSFEEC